MPLLPFLRSCLRQSSDICWTLFKLMIPISLIVKLLTYTGYIEWVARVLSPLMRLVGLSGAAAIVWATAMLTNLYGGVVAYAGMATHLPMTVAQASVLTGMMLIAHNLPVEVKIAQRSGTRFRMMLGLRVGAALLFGMLFSRVLGYFNLLQGSALIVWKNTSTSHTILGVVLNELQTYLKIFLIVFFLVVLLKTLEKLNLTRYINLALMPLLRPLGLSEKAAPLTMVGMVLGIAYGGGLIIAEAETGHLAQRDLFAALSLLGVCHSLIEDTFVMVMLGGNLTVILLGRVLFSLLVVKGLMVIYDHAPSKILDRYFVRKINFEKARMVHEN